MKTPPYTVDLPQRLLHLLELIVADPDPAGLAAVLIHVAIWDQDNRAVRAKKISTETDISNN